MAEVPLSRRRLLASTAAGIAGVTIAGCLDGDGDESGSNGSNGSDGTNASGGPDVDESREAGRDTHAIMADTRYETTVHVLDSGDGPTGMVLGGVHGNEVGGIEAARLATEYELSAGRLVVIPETNAPAVENEGREGPNGDLNRQFPVGEEPTTELARAVWEEIESYDPACLIDMHTSRGILGVDEGAVGQAIFPSPAEGASEDGQQAAEYMNEEVLDEFLESNPEYAFRSGPVEGVEIEQSDEVDLMAVTKAGADLGTKGWITEVTYKGFDVDQQTFIHDRLTTWLLAENGVETESPFDDQPNPLPS